MSTRPPSGRSRLTSRSRGAEPVISFGQSLWVREQAAKLAEPRFVVSPALDRGSVNRLARLQHTGGLDHTAVLLRLQTGIVPFEADERDQFAGCLLSIADEILVVDLEEAIGRNH